MIMTSNTSYIIFRPDSLVGQLTLLFTLNTWNIPKKMLIEIVEAYDTNVRPVRHA